MFQDVHNPTPTPCPLCGKIFSSKHKMFGHKYRSCPNRTRNLVRHLEDMDGSGGAGGGAPGNADPSGNPNNAAGNQPGQAVNQQQQQQAAASAVQHQQPF